MKKRLIHIAIDGSWYDVLKLLFKHDIDTLNYIDTFIGKGLIRWSNFVDSAAADDNNIFFSDDDYDEDEDDAEEEEDFFFGSVYRKSDEEKFLLLFLQRINSKFINFDNVMYHACHFGHSSPVLWLLKNKSSYQFDMRYIMNKVCFHGDLKLIRYLSKKYSADRFDYKSAMIKACRGHRTSTLPVCKWLWKNIDHSVFDMKIALNNASRFNNCRVIEWILADVGTFLDPETALHNACEHGSEYTVNVLLAKSTIKMFDIQSLISCACRNADDGCSITKLLLKRADKSTLDLNAVFSLACKCVNIDIVQLLIEIFAPSISETSHGNNIYSKNHVDINMLIDCILDMGSHESKKENETKSKLLMLILHKWIQEIEVQLLQMCVK
ncbi:Hypothetical predicted protein [Mytilus galloprovincialis]|uniref:Ankyrin repeat protein n=1 Tax=Mytilus galloprovincialis TaxID=29158 RepID=A0A8B6FCA7_MYTGA|nr:Hypothetical predicted protein [Mytilus galloprovincialis]